MATAPTLLSSPEAVPDMTSGSIIQDLFTGTDSEVNTDYSDVNTISTRSTRGVVIDYRFIHIVIGLVGIVSNFLVITIIFAFTELRKRVAHIFIVNQSVLDFIASILMVVTYSLKFANVNPTGAWGDFYCRVITSETLLWSAFMSSTYNLVALTFERYFKIVHVVTHKVSFTRNRAKIILISCWLIGPIYNFAYIIPTTAMVGDQCWSVWFWDSAAAQQAVGILTIMVQFFIPLIVITYCYIHILVVLHRKAKVNPTNAATGNSQGDGNQLSRAQTNVTKTLFIVALTFVFCWSWNEIYFLLYNIGYNFTFQDPFFHFSLVMVFLNSCLNPLIYLTKLDEFRRGLKALMFRNSVDASEST